MGSQQPLSRQRSRRRFSAGVAALLFLLTGLVPLRADNLAWNAPFPPFKIADNLYYVGTAALASYLLTSPDGDILINPSYDSTVPIIETSVEKLGFKMHDVKIILVSHAHDDHAAGCARLKQLTGAKLMVMAPDVAEIENGGVGDFQYANQRWPKVHVDRVLHDGDQVKLGSLTLTAHLTPGHTKGCTTWTFDVPLAGQLRHVVLVGSPNVNPGYQLVDNRLYPHIAADFQKTFTVMKSLPCDIFLGAHGEYFGLKEKYQRYQKGDANAFIDPAGYRDYVADRDEAFRKELARQQHKLGSKE